MGLRDRLLRTETEGDRPNPTPVDRRVWDLLLAADGPLAVAEISDGTGQHPNTVRSHLALLVEMGRVEAVPEARTRPGRPKLLYRALAQAEPTDPYRALAAELAAAAVDSPHTPGEAAGRRLARTQLAKAASALPPTPDQAVGMATDGLEVLGFSTETDRLGDRLYLDHCPFAELAREDRAICRLHHELLTGFFDELDSGVSVRRLDVFVKGDLCVAHLTRPDLDPAPQPATRPSEGAAT